MPAFTVGDASYWEVIFPIISSMYGIIAFCIILLPIIGSALIFKKANISWWTAIIPFYNEYKMLELVGKKKWFIGYIFSIVGSYVGIMLGTISAFLAFFALFADKADMFVPTMFLGFMIGGMCSILLFVENCVKCVALTKKMHMPGGMAVGLILLPQIFYLIAGINRNYQFKVEQPYNQMYNQIYY